MEITKEQFEKYIYDWVIQYKYSKDLARKIYEYSKTELPKEYKIAKFPLYRGLTLTSKQLHILGFKQRLELRPQLITSWTPDKKVALSFARSEKNGVILELINKPQIVVCNIAKMIENNYISLFEYGEASQWAQEVLIDSKKAYIESINTNNLFTIIAEDTSYVGPVKVKKFFEYWKRRH